MLSVDQARGELQYRLLDSTRAFAINLLESHGELDAISASHARLQLEILARAAAEYATMPTRKWYATYATQADDLRKAIDWSLHVQFWASSLPPQGCPYGVNCRLQQRARGTVNER
jgi:predicted ATPase